MRPLSATLNDLIGFAEKTVTRPSMFAGTLDAQFAALAAEVRQADARPAEHVRTTRAALVMVNVLEGFFEGDRDPDAAHVKNPWLMLAGATLPLLRVDAWRAFNNEKRARAG